MPSQQTSLLVDTNIWLDYFLANRPAHAAAMSFMLFAHEHGYPLLYPTAIVKDVFYLTANVFKRDMRNENGRLTERDAAAATEIAWGCVPRISWEKLPARATTVLSHPCKYSLHTVISKSIPSF